MNKLSLNTVFKSLLLVFFTLAFIACGSKKEGADIGGKLEKKTKNELISDVINSELKYTTISGKMDIELIPANSKKRVKTGSFVKLIRDSILQISIRPFLGVEAFRISLTPDSAYMIDRYNKKYAVEAIDNLQKTSGAFFNFYNLQALLTNSLFLPGEKSVEADNYRLYDIGVASDMYLAKTKDKSGILYNFAIDGSDRIASTLIFSTNNSFTLQWAYKDFIKDGSYVYPTTMEANIGTQKLRLDTKISFPKVDINKNIDVENSVPRKYEKASVGEIIKAYMK